MTSQLDSQNYANAVSKASAKKKSAKYTRVFQSLDGKEYGIQEFRMLNWERRIEILLYNIAIKVLDT